MKYFNYFILFFLAFVTLQAQDSVQTFLALEPTGVAEFHRTNPEYDGRGTIVFVLDTGVDMGVPGLTTTSTGEVKVIDVQDFTGEGDVEYYEADTDEEDGVNYFINEDEDLKVAGAGKLSLTSVDDEYFIGALKEKMLQNSGSHAGDLNGNDKNDDVYVFVTFQAKIDTSDFWVVYLDTNGNGDLSDEKPLRNYKINHDSFTIDNETSLPPFTMALNIFPEENKVVFFFDDGAHGTHCAGIATGNKIGGADFYGVAPGANVIGLKLGNNNFAGGATVTGSMKKAFEYFANYASQTDKPCIVNMSFGIGSEIEDRAAIEDYLKELTKENPYIYISTSNGNEGPGISTTGMPASTSAIFSSGAILTRSVGTDMYGVEINRDLILHFSSRGGEVMKPDVVSPGASASTIPNFMPRDRMWGTSMASPYSAGVMSLLLSAMSQEYPDVKIPAQLLYKAMREGAVKMKNYDALDQGGGYINVVNSFKILKKYVDSGELKKFETYTISSFAPNMPKSKAPALYIRNGNYLTGNEKYSFSVKRNNFIDKKKFYRILSIKSDSDWLKPIQTKVHFRNDQTVRVDVLFDKSKMSEPGLYNGVITAYRTDKSKTPEFSMMATVVIPYQFNSDNNYKVSFRGKKVGVGELNRYFIDIPAGASTMKIKMSSDEKTYTDVWYHLHKPNGEGAGIKRLLSNEDDDSVEKEYFNMEPGVWELDVMGLFIASGESTYNLAVSFEGLQTLTTSDLNETHNIIRMVNNYNSVYSYMLGGTILGYKETVAANVKSYEHYAIPFVLRKDEAQKTFDVKLSKEDFNKVTDYALMIYDEDGKAVAIGGLSYKEGSVSIKNTFDADSTNLKFVMIPAFTNDDDELLAHVTISSELKQSSSFKVTVDGRNRASFYPGVIYNLVCDLQTPEVFFPKEAKFYGKIDFKNTNNKLMYSLPINFNF
ncbi:MAG: S8 family serine peptidase [Chlorobi bacterium]|nr:S8 family serine peptidase [Chlorobiota bacterium]